jgi:cytochrome P450
MQADGPDDMSGVSILSGQDQDPYPMYEELRRRGSVLWDRRLQGWLVLSYELCKYIEQNEQLYRHPYFGASPQVVDIKGGGTTVTIAQGEEHQKIRRFTQRLFTPSAVATYRDKHVRPVVHWLIDRFIGRGQADLASELTDLVPPRVLASLCALPWQDDALIGEIVSRHDLIATWIGRPGRGQELTNKAVQASHELNDILRPYILERREHPSDDLISRIWKEGADAGITDEADVVANCRELFFAGSHTTIGGLANAVYLLLSQPDVRTAVAADRRAALAGFIEESLRLLSPLQFRYRLANQDGDLGGVSIKKDQLVFMVHAAANRDPQKYECPAATMLKRPRLTDHLTFNAGPRTCIGAPLARVELREVLEAVLDRMKNVRFDPHAAPPQERSVFARAYRPLNVLFDPAPL